MTIFANVIEDAFSPLIVLFEHILVFLHGIVGNWGLAIVCLTMVIRAALVPLTFRQLRAMQELQRLSPELQKLKEKYKDDKQRQQQEMMKLYQERGVNPFASCLPLLLQLPVFISLFYMLRTDLKNRICGSQMIKGYETALGHTVSKFSALPEHATKATNAASKYVSGIGGGGVGHAVKGVSEVGCNVVAPGSAHFLFLTDITEKATGVSLIVLIVVYVASQLGSTMIATATADPTQRRLMLFLPLIFVIILYRYPSGLLLYWITTNLWTIGQQLVIRRRMPPPEKPPELDGKPKKSLKDSIADAVGPPKTPEPAAAPANAPPPPPARKKKKRSGRRR